MIPNDADWQKWVKNEIEYESFISQEHTKKELLEYQTQHTKKQLLYYIKWNLCLKPSY